MMNYFSETYDESKNRFKALLPELSAIWPNVRYSNVPIYDNTLTMDIIKTEACREKKNQLVLISGVHGVEGYIGSALMQYFVKHMLTLINPDTTGICMVHAVNPWGMASYQRNNEHNVDLNRNFVLDWEIPLENKAYEQMEEFLGPGVPVQDTFCSRLVFLVKTMVILSRFGSSKVKRATMMGQYHAMKGIYYGGSEPEVSTKAIMSLFDDMIESHYKNQVLLDIHSGYGPKNMMTIVNSTDDIRNPYILQSCFGYKPIIKTSSDTFYPIHGDMIDYLYRKYPEHTKNEKFYATCLEFGTGGEGLIQQLKSLYFTIKRNQLNHYGSGNIHTEQSIKKGFERVFRPQSPAWSNAAIQDFEKAVTGILDIIFDEE